MFSDEKMLQFKIDIYNYIFRQLRYFDFIIRCTVDLLDDGQL